MKKTFDCLEMKRRAAAQLRAMLAQMTREEQLAFWQHRTDELRKLQQQAAAAQAESAAEKSQ